MVGTITLSLEIELAWGLHDLSSETKFRPLSPERRKETEALKRLLRICDQYEIPFSFGIVGHLLQEECAGSHPGPYPPGWFDQDPGTNIESDPHFYAPDLVRKIRDAPVEHELCTHTYSHVLCDRFPSESIEHDLERAREEHVSTGLSQFSSLIPPRHRLPDRSVLKRAGIRTVRVPVDTPPDSTARTIRQKAKSFGRILGRSHPIVPPSDTAGVLETYTSLEPSLTAPFLPDGQEPPHPVFRPIPLETRRAIQKRYLREAVNQAIEKESYAHLWSHLFNLANDAQWLPIRDFIEYLATRRDAGDVVIKPMNELGA